MGEKNIQNFMNNNTTFLPSIIHKLTFEGKEKEIIQLIKLKPNIIHHVDDSNQTAAHIAAIKGDVKLMEIFIDAGVDINSKDENEFSLLHRAVESNSFFIVSLLVNKGVDVNIKNKFGATALHYASSKGYTKIVKFLLEKGSNSNEKSSSGWTPLHAACAKGNIECAKLLLKYGSDPLILNNNQKNSFDVTCKMELKMILKLKIDQMNKQNDVPLPSSEKKGSNYDTMRAMIKKEKSSDQPINLHQSSNQINNKNKTYEEIFFALQQKEKEITKMKEKINEISEKNMKFEAKISTLESQLMAGNKSWEIQWSDLSFDKVIGKGNFGEVFRGVWRGTAVAIKTIPGDQEKHLHELVIMQHLRPHFNVVQFLGYCQYMGNIYIIFEYLPYGSLEKYLKRLSSKGKSLSINNIVKFCMEIAAGMAHLHEEGVLHRDLAARNILLKLNQKGEISAAISDFGLSRQTEVYMSNTGYGPIKWMPPEFLDIRKREFHKTSDVWSFGVVIWEMMMKKEPYEGIDGQTAGLSIIRGEKLEIPSYCTPELSDVLNHCWELKASSRPSFRELFDKLQQIQTHLI